MKSLLFFIFISIFISSNFAQNGDCITPSLFVQNLANSSNTNSLFTECIVPVESAGKIIIYSSVKSSPNGTLGLVQKIAPICSDNSLYSSRFAELFIANDCTSSPISPSKTIAHTYNSTTFNPEWSGLLPSTNYTVKITINVPNSCSGTINEVCLNQYFPQIYTCPNVDFTIASPSTTFNCTDPKVKLLSIAPPSSTNADKWMYPGFIIRVWSLPGYSFSNNQKLTFLDNGTVVMDEFYLANPMVWGIDHVQPGSYSFGITNIGMKEFGYEIVNAADGKVIESGVFNSSKTVSGTYSPVGTSSYTITKDVTGALATGVSNDPNSGGDGFFDPSISGEGTFNITYSWDNGAGCTGTSSPKKVVVTCPPPTCGVVGIDWVNPSPNSANLICSNNTDYSLKATNTIANGFTAPGFTINDAAGNIVYSKIEIEEGLGTGFINAGVQKIVKYCSPSLQYSVKLTGNGIGNVTFTDHATGKTIYTGAFISGSVIVLSPNSMLGSVTFSGPGVSNNQKSKPTLIGNGYGVFNPAIAGPGTHTITYTWDNGMGCNGTITKAVTVTGISIKPTFNTMSTQCPNSVAQILQPTSNNSIIGTWNPLTVNTSTLGKTTYTFTPNAGQCATIETLDVTIKPIVKPTFNLTNNYCFNYPAQALPTTSDNSIIGIWNPASINTNISGSSIYQFTPNTDQCGSKVSETITVFEKPIANVIPSTISGKAILEVYFTNLSTNATKLNWDYGNGETSTTIGNTSSSYTNVGNYNVTLIASNGVCPDSIWKTIITVLPIDPLTFNIPNIFTPNNDGVNDHYFIELENAASFEAKIFNRWGNEMISQNKINEKWDGKSASGKMSDDGVYFIKYKIIGLDKTIKEGVASFQLQN